MNRVVEMDRKFRGGEEDPSVITEMNVYAVLLYAQGKMDQVWIGEGRVGEDIYMLYTIGVFALGVGRGLPGCSYFCCTRYIHHGGAHGFGIFF